MQSITALAGLIVTSTAFAQPSYTLELLPDAGFDGSTARAINDLGQVVGQAADSSGNTFGVLWNPDGSVVTLDNVSSVTVSGEARGINNSGLIVGESRNDANLAQAVVWDTAGNATPIGNFIGGTFGFANAVNDNGTVVGTAGSANGQVAYTWSQAGGLVNYGNVDIPFTSTAGFEGVSNTEEFVGTAFVGFSPFKAVRASAAEPELVEISPPGQFSTGLAYDVSDSGVIVGTQNPGSGSGQPAIFDGTGGVTLLGDLGIANADGSALAINEAGTIVGGIQGFDDSNPFMPTPVNAAFVYDDGTLYDLSTLFANDLGIDGLVDATGINESGVITGTAVVGGELVAFVARPVPEPTSIGFVALVGAAMLRRRR